MYKYLLVYLATTLIDKQSTFATLCITKVIVRVPREKDIGLIFGELHPKLALSYLS